MCMCNSYYYPPALQNQYRVGNVRLVGLIFHRLPPRTSPPLCTQTVNCFLKPNRVKSMDCVHYGQYNTRFRCMLSPAATHHSICELPNGHICMRWQITDASWAILPPGSVLSRACRRTTMGENRFYSIRVVARLDEYYAAVTKVCTPVYTLETRRLTYCFSSGPGAGNRAGVY